MSGVKLTKAQRECLEHCKDWSAPFEIAMRRHQSTGEIVSGIGTHNALGRLRNLGLVEYGPPNDTFRITPSGLQALSQAKSQQEGETE